MARSRHTEIRQDIRYHRQDSVWDSATQVSTMHGGTMNEMLTALLLIGVPAAALFAIRCAVTRQARQDNGR